jgi:hypothetical protein
VVFHCSVSVLVGVFLLVIVLLLLLFLCICVVVVFVLRSRGVRSGFQAAHRAADSTGGPFRL